jgi:nucleoside-diphosphate-sugar epimerase
MKKLLITGATGVIGQGLARRFAGEYEIIGVGKRPVPWEVEHEMMYGDLCQSRFIAQLPKVDGIVHAAGYAQPKKFEANAFETLQLGTYATSLLMSRLEPKGKFLFVSSAHVYKVMDPDPTHPRACYIEAKRCGEVVTWQMRRFGFESKVVRPALVYGPGVRAHDRRVMSEFIERGLKGPIVVHGDGTATRTYCYVDDACEMIGNVFDSGKKFLYNVGGESRVTIMELAGMIAKKMNRAVERRGEGVKGAPEDEGVKITRYVREFGKVGFTGLSEGLDRTIEWIRRVNELETAR